jgi:nucleoside-diphosphate-sugar epimerase
VFRLWGDNQKLERLTGFKPSITLKQGLQHTIDWFLRPENLQAYKSNQYVV